MMKVFAIYDTKAQAYGTPFFLLNSAVAIREFSTLANDHQSKIAVHPTDYILFELGLFDDGNGLLTPVTPPINLGLASDFVMKVV